MASRRPALLLLLLSLAAALSLAGCGDGQTLREEAEQRVEDARERVEELGREARDRAERLRDRLTRRVRETLERIRRAVPAATPATRVPQRADSDFERFLTEVLENVDGYWTTTLREADLPEPRVGYVWVPPGERAATACGAVADDDSAFYCPADDTIYVAQQFAAEVLQGIRSDLPGQAAGEGRAIGDFGVAYIVAHEYAHNVQQELGWFTAGRRVAVKPFELQADCMSGAWAFSVYESGRLEEGDVEEALSTAKAVGDFDNLDPQHHGTPDERHDAWLRGYESGDPSTCQAYVPR